MDQSRGLEKDISGSKKRAARLTPNYSELLQVGAQELRATPSGRPRTPSYSEPPSHRATQATELSKLE